MTWQFPRLKSGGASRARSKAHMTFDERQAQDEDKIVQFLPAGRHESADRKLRNVGNIALFLSRIPILDF
jgi:hypothetical protein